MSVVFCNMDGYYTYLCVCHSFQFGTRIHPITKKSGETIQLDPEKSREYTTYVVRNYIFNFTPAFLVLLANPDIEGA